MPEQSSADRSLHHAGAEPESELATARIRPKPAPRASDSAAPTSGAVQLRCPHCLQSIDVVADQLSRDVACPACGDAFSVESLVAASGLALSPPSRRLGRYVLGERLGAGAFGSVWRARDTELARDVAVKLPRSGQFTTPHEEERFLREARSAAHLHHSGIVAVYDVGCDEGTPYIVSELVHGVSLAEWLRSAWLSFREAADLVARLAEALDYAHRCGVVHRDVKPSNIMMEERANRGEGRGKTDSSVTSRPSPLAPRLMDFGLALRDAAEVTMTVDGQVLGTPAYMSPEQVTNPHNVDGRSDIYSLGVILYQLMTGELPFRGVTRMVLHQVAADAPRPPRRVNDKIPLALETICLKCLAKERGRRYQTAGALAADLTRWLAGQPILAQPMSRMERLGAWVKSNPALVLAAGLACVGVGAATAAPVAVALVVLTVASFLFALHKSKAAAGLAEDLAEANQQRKKTAATLQFVLGNYHQVRDERQHAVAAETQAKRRFGQLQELAHAFLFDLPDKLAEVPGTVAARVFLVRTAQAYLDGLAKEVGDDTMLLRDLAVAYSRVADLQGNLSHSSLEDYAGALASHRKSLEIFEALAKAHPQNIQAQRDLAVSRRKVADLAALGK